VIKIILSFFFIVLLSACGKGGISTFSAPESTDVKTVFANACAKCHGDNGGGQFGLFSTLNPEGKTEQILAETILSGREGMPAFIKLTEEQRLALAKYIIEIRQ